MKNEELRILRNLISGIEGAPYPNIIGNELYTIWYEHVQIAANEALEFLSACEPACEEGKAPGDSF